METSTVCSPVLSPAASSSPGASSSSQANQFRKIFGRAEKHQIEEATSVAAGWTEKSPLGGGALDERAAPASVLLTAERRIT